MAKEKGLEGTRTWGTRDQVPLEVPGNFSSLWQPGKKQLCLEHVFQRFAKLVSHQSSIAHRCSVAFHWALLGVAWMLMGSMLVDD